jgi:hypothetical protein
MAFTTIEGKSRFEAHPKDQSPLATFRVFLQALDSGTRQISEEVLQSVYREMFRLDSCELLGSYEKTVTAAGTAQTFSSTH